MMRKFFALAVALALGGCLTTTVTQGQLDTVRASYDAAFLTPAAHYRQLGYCRAGTNWTLAKPCADRATVAKLLATDARLHATFNTLQAEVTAGGGAAAVSDFTILQALITNARALIATLPN